MKRVLNILLSFTMVVSIIFAGGCKNQDIFAGNYETVTKSKVSNVIKHFQENEEALIDWTSGLSINIYQKTDKQEMTIDAKITSSLLDKSKGVGEWNIELAVGERTENTKLIYDGVYLYKDLEFAGNIQKTKGKVKFNDVVDFTDIEDFDDMIGEVLYMATEEKNVSFYLDESDKDLIKLKIEQFIDEEGFGGTNFVCYFVFDTNYELEAIKIDMQIEDEDYSTEMEFCVEKWSGSISIPEYASEYNEIDDILN